MTRYLERYMSQSKQLKNYAIVTTNLALHTLSINKTNSANLGFFKGDNHSNFTDL